MDFDVLYWAGAINAVLLIRVLLVAPRAMQLSGEAELLKQKAAMLWAEIEKEKVTRGVTDADRARESRLGSEAQAELFRLTKGAPTGGKP